jgi:hypothetical protein
MARFETSFEDGHFFPMIKTIEISSLLVLEDRLCLNTIRLQQN